MTIYLPPVPEPPPFETDYTPTVPAPAVKVEFGPKRSALFDIETEQAVLGCVLLNPEAFDDLARLTPEHFYLIKHRWVWDCFLKLINANTPIDFLTVSAELDKRQKLEEAGGTFWLSGLLNATPNSLNAAAYSLRLHDLWQRRKVLESATQLATLAYAEEANIEDGINQHVSQLERSIFAGTGEVVSISTAMSKLLDHTAKIRENPNAFGALSSGFPDLDKMLGGGLFQREMTLFSGDPGVGKTKLVMQLAKNLAAGGHPGAVFEMEMPMLQLTSRMVSASTGITTRSMQYGPLDDGKIDEMVYAMGQLSNLPVWISTDDTWNTLTLRATLSRLVRECEIKWAIVDFFDLLTDDFTDPYLRDTVMSRRLSSMARTLNLCLIVVDTLNKTGMNEKEKKLGHLSGSGKKAYAANNILHLTAHIPEKGFQPDSNLVTISASKMRDYGIGGSIDLVKLAGHPAFGSVVSRTVDLKANLGGARAANLGSWGREGSARSD